MVKQISKNLCIGQYLLDRLSELRVQHIFGVPGDYILGMDKLIEEHQDIEFINATTENAAGGAADGYARMRGLGVACITFGVGISIVNAMAQAYVESSPIVVISGNAGTDEYARSRFLHHLINQSQETEYDRTQHEIFKNVTIDQGILDDPNTASEIIDRVLSACLKYKKPVYLEIPRNKVHQSILTPFIPFKFPHLPNNPENLEKALNEIKTTLSSCLKPIIWAGHEILRYQLTQPLLAFAEKYKIPIITTLLGKTVVDEHHPLWAGVYQGGMSAQSVLDLVNESDCMLITGVILSDLDTGFFTTKLENKTLIDINAQSIKINDKTDPHISYVDLMHSLGKIELKTNFAPRNIIKKTLSKSFKPIPGAKNTMKRFIECVQSHITDEHIIVTDVGDSLFASADLVLYENSFMACAYFANIGFAIPGALGIQLAKPDRRVIAIVGDGGFQMTAMELSMAVKNYLDLIVIVLNNHGYTTERVLLEGSFNDIVDWNYAEIPKVLGGGIGIKAETEEAFEKAFTEALNQREEFYLIEATFDKNEYSPALKRLGDLLSKTARGK